MKAANWAQKGADNGDPRAQLILAYLYENGLGVKEDAQKAFALYTKSANKGETFSMYSLGVMYEEGRGVEKNREKAIEWYQKAASRDSTPAQKKMAEIQSKSDK
ncbi:sel1 repeat family protein [Oxalobacter vibrioformis]|uniref:Sel1 repeat family protein n=1 Tax=Oxalobacter vibrioformis TaxID=933080 RepID=A0A9E9P2G9_9BURK|nr:tetratricopeptide repeat protein [Oxalobacter vibrioformis]WAW09869.1 sel1 repeat family protein [Oxalobacter vibrioformis]